MAKESGRVNPPRSGRPDSGVDFFLSLTKDRGTLVGMTTTKLPIIVARGDGIGPEIMDAVLRILAAAEAPLEPVEIQIGEKVYHEGHTSGISPAGWETLRQHHIFLKAPITTPSGGGYKSLNVTIRKALGLFANVRPCKSYYPWVKTHYPNINLVIVRENEEDLYAGIEHRQTSEVYQTLKLISRPGTEAICRYAFEYARAYDRKRVTCLTKDNIMKLSDGLFHKVFDEIATEYPDIKADHQIIDIGAARVAAEPESLDVVVTLNLYGDIVSDIAALVSGSVGLAGSANIGRQFAMFEAVHGSAPDIAGKDIANPSGLLNAAIMMLVHAGFGTVAEKIKNAWLCTLEQGQHTLDIFSEGRSAQRLGTSAFADAVISHLGETPEQGTPIHYAKSAIQIETKPRPTPVKKLLGSDVFLHWDESDRDPDVLGPKLEALCPPGLRLSMISNRGQKVYPGGIEETFCTDHWRCRFISEDGTDHATLIALLEAVRQAGLDFIKTENLYSYDGERGYSLGQGE